MRDRALYAECDTKADGSEEPSPEASSAARCFMFTSFSIRALAGLSLIGLICLCHAREDSTSKESRWEHRSQVKPQAPTFLSQTIQLAMSPCDCPSPDLGFPFGKSPVYAAEKTGSTVLLVGTLHSAIPMWIGELEKEIKHVAPFTQVFTENDHGKLLALVPLVLDAIADAVEKNGEDAPSKVLMEQYGLDKLRGIDDAGTDDGTMSALSKFKTLGELKHVLSAYANDPNAQGVDARVVRLALVLSKASVPSPSVLESGFVSNCYMRPAAKAMEFCKQVGARGRNESTQKQAGISLCQDCYDSKATGTTCIASLEKAIAKYYVTGDYEKFAKSVVAGYLLTGFLAERNQAWAKLIIDAAPTRALVAVGAAHLVDIPGQANSSMLHSFEQAGYSIRKADVLIKFPNFPTPTPTPAPTIAPSSSSTPEPTNAPTSAPTPKPFICVARTDSSTILPYCEACCNAKTCNPIAKIKKIKSWDWKSKCDDCLASSPGCKIPISS